VAEERQNAASLREANDAAAKRDAFIDSSNKQLLVGRLAGMTVDVVVLPGTEGSLVKSTTDTLTEAGAKVGATVQVKPTWFDASDPGGRRDLAETQLAALSALEVHQAMTPGELAEHEKVQPPSMTRVIAVLEERSLVLRSPHPTDRRQVILTVTEEGRAVVQRVRRRKDAWLARRLAELSTEERAALRAAVPVLEKLSQSS